MLRSNPPPRALGVVDPLVIAQPVGLAPAADQLGRESRQRGHRGPISVETSPASSPRSGSEVLTRSGAVGIAKRYRSWRKNAGRNDALWEGRGGEGTVGGQGWGRRGGRAGRKNAVWEGRGGEGRAGGQGGRSGQGSAGRVTENLAPPLGDAPTSIDPPWRATTSATIAKPSPAPLRPRRTRDSSSCVNRSKMRSR